MELGGKVAIPGETSSQLARRDPDISLMIQVRDDVSGAFEQLVQHYQGRLVVILNHLIGNQEEAEDLAQEVFLRVYRSRKSYHPKSRFSTWLFTIANNLAVNSLRTKARKPAAQFRPGDSSTSGLGRGEKNVPDHRSGPTKRIQRQELTTIIRQAIDSLGERQRMAVVLNKFEDMGYAEIAEIMGLSVKAVKSLLSRARMNLKDQLAAYIYPEGIPPGFPESSESST